MLWSNFEHNHFGGEIFDIKRMGFAKKVMHDSFFKCKSVAPLCLNMYLLFSIFSPLPETFGASKEITASIWWSFRVTTQVAAKQLPQLGHTAFWLLCYKVYSFKQKVTHYCCFLSLLVPYMWAEPLRWRSKVWNGVMYWVSLVRFLVFFSRSCSRSRKEEEYKEWFWLCFQEYTFLRSVSISNCPTFFNVWRIFCNSICFNPMFKATSTYNGAIMCQCVQTHVQCKTCNNEYNEKYNYKYNLYSWMCTNVKGKKHPWNFSRRH